MPFCLSCGFQIKEGDRFCNACGAQCRPSFQAVEPVCTAQRGASPLSLAAGFVAGQVITLIGSAMLIVGPLLSWITGLWLSVSGLQMTGNKALALMMLGMAGVVFAVVSLTLKRQKYLRAQFVVGLAGLGTGIYFALWLRDQVPGWQAALYLHWVSVGAGIYLCIAGGVTVLVGGVVVAASRKR